MQLRYSVFVDAKKLKDSDLYNNVYIARRRVTNTVTRVPVDPVSTPSQESQQVLSAEAGAGAEGVADTTQRVPPGALSSEPAAPTPPNL